MISPLEDALGRLENAYLARGSSQLVERVDLDPDGTLHLTLEGSPARWFRFDEGGLREVVPEEDELLPVARELVNGLAGKDGALLSYRPGRRLVVRRRAKDAVTIIKGYRRRRSQEAARLHRLALAVTPDAGLRVPRLLEHRADHDCLVLEHLAGEALRLSAEDAEVFFPIGMGLRRFQQASSDDLAIFGSAEELGVLDTWAERASSANGPLPEGWSASRERLVAARDDLPDAVIGLAHRDLHDGQLLVNGPSPALLDFDLLCLADVALDPANMLAHLTLRSLQGIRGADESGVLACGEAFLEGLDRQGEPGFWRRLRFYQATTFLRLALIYDLRPRWSALSPVLIDLSRRCLDEYRADGR